MSALENLRSDLRKILENNNKISEDAIQEFTLKKGIKASSTEEIIRNSNNPMIALEMNRFIDAYKDSLFNPPLKKEGILMVPETEDPIIAARGMLNGTGVLKAYLEEKKQDKKMEDKNFAGSK